MDSDAKQTIIDGMRNFNSIISFVTSQEPNKLIKEAIKTYPQILYYLHSWQIRGGILNHYEMHIKYVNRDTPMADILIVSSKDECVKKMQNAVADYKRKMIVVVANIIDLSKMTNEFRVKYSAFYPNLTEIRAGYRSFGDYLAYEFEFEYRIGQVKLNMMELEVDKEVERISKMLFSDDMPIEAKIYLAHNYLATTVTYVDNNKNSLDTSYTQSAYGALIKHECVCQGYAEAFKRIMDYNCIKCEVVAGKIIGSTEHHAWNIVSLGKDDSYFHIDVTWDSADGRPSYLYFCKNDYQFSQKRIWDRNLTPFCPAKYAVLSIARKYVFSNKNKLLAKGINHKILDC